MHSCKTSRLFKNNTFLVLSVTDDLLQGMTFSDGYSRHVRVDSRDSSPLSNSLREKTCQIPCPAAEIQDTASFTQGRLVYKFSAILARILKLDFVILFGNVHL